MLRELAGSSGPCSEATAWGWLEARDSTAMPRRGWGTSANSPGLHAGGGLRTGARALVAGVLTLLWTQARPWTYQVGERDRSSPWCLRQVASAKERSAGRAEQGCPRAGQSLERSQKLGGS